MSSCAQKVRIVLAEKGVEFETVPVDTPNKEHLQAEFLSLNPWATVPVLQLNDGTCISEAIACCRYLEEAYPEPPLFGKNPKEKATIAMWEHRMEWDGFLAVAEYLRNTAERMKNRGLTGLVNFEQIPALAERGKKRVAHFHSILEERLGESEYVVGEYYTIADVTAQVSLDFGNVWHTMPYVYEVILIGFRIRNIHDIRVTTQGLFNQISQTIYSDLVLAPKVKYFPVRSR